MHCPRLDHFVRFNANGTVSRCGHMVNAPEFDTLEDLESSVWLAKIREKMQSDKWPAECVRCQETEPNSIRQYAIDLGKQTEQLDYLQVGGVLDNVCNAACLSCNETLSTRIGSLNGSGFPVYNNLDRFWTLPQERIVHLDINGGEPSYSKNYKKLLANLPPNLKTLRLNTNCSTVLEELIDIASRGIEVTVTVSCDGIGPVHELARWPISWQTFYNNLMRYKAMPVKLNLWTTVSVLNVDDLPNILAFAQEHGIDHSWAYLKQPEELSVDNTNAIARDRYILKQLTLRDM
jgi:MoaA/NifB/PqqE/SkfB family radical SAM enzyme